MHVVLQLLALSYVAFFTPAIGKKVEARQNCASNYSKCNPSGATATSTPDIGEDLSSMYQDLLNSISTVKQSKRSVEHEIGYKEKRASSPGFCCAVGTACLLLQQFNTPLCYDKFTTNYLLPDTSYGNVASGDYETPDGGKINLLSGDYTQGDGTPGNIYSAPDAPSKPNTATLSIPTVFTGTGVGSAIAVTSLGEEATYTTTIPGTTIQPTTVPASTESAPSITTLPPSTVPGTTIAPITTVVTTHLPPGVVKSGASSFLVNRRALVMGFGAVASLTFIFTP
ncbi:hypothetical protein MMC09_000736 [Bachmanniomyces sp. S44760]|nr:hypothetical protein [Bachmanniomyces sp. S44760]